MKRIERAEELKPGVPTWYTTPEPMSRGRIIVLDYRPSAHSGRFKSVDHLFVAGYLESMRYPMIHVEAVLKNMRRQMFGY